MNQIDTIDAKQQMIAQMDEAVSKGNFFGACDHLT